MYGVESQSRKGTDVAVIKRPSRAQSDLDCQFAIGGEPEGGILAILGDMDDTEINLRLDPLRPGSHTVTLGKPCGTRTPTAPLKIALPALDLHLTTDMNRIVFVSPRMELPRFSLQMTDWDSGGGPQFQY